MTAAFSPNTETGSLFYQKLRTIFTVRRNTNILQRNIFFAAIFLTNFIEAEQIFSWLGPSSIKKIKPLLIKNVGVNI